MVSNKMNLFVLISSKTHLFVLQTQNVCSIAKTSLIWSLLQEMFLQLFVGTVVNNLCISHGEASYHGAFLQLILSIGALMFERAKGHDIHPERAKCHDNLKLRYRRVGS